MQSNISYNLIGNGKNIVLWNGSQNCFISNTGAGYLSMWAPSGTLPYNVSNTFGGNSGNGVAGRWGFATNEKYTAGYCKIPNKELPTIKPSMFVIRAY